MVGATLNHLPPRRRGGRHAARVLRTRVDKDHRAHCIRRRRDHAAVAAAAASASAAASAAASATAVSSSSAAFAASAASTPSAVSSVSSSATQIRSVGSEVSTYSVSHRGRGEKPRGAQGPRGAPSDTGGAGRYRVGPR
jgi:hypothetical protein